MIVVASIGISGYNYEYIVHAPIAQLDRAVVSGTTSAGGSNPSGRVLILFFHSRERRKNELRMPFPFYWEEAFFITIR